MKQKKYIGKSLKEVEILAVQELGVAYDDLYFDVISPDGTKDEEMEIDVIVDANPVKKGKDFLENFLKEAFLPPHPYLSRTFKRGEIFLGYIVRSIVESTVFALHPRLKVFSQVFFKKLAGVWGE